MEAPVSSTSSSASSVGMIRRLDEAVVNRIAAGEVIQRPANAIKEMIENSMDAKASSISVVVSEGGLKLMQISDNGTGMRRADLPLVCQRFATSKLSKFEDLSTIGTFGFRGEALASISHVAHLTLLTKTSDSPCGFQASYRDGVLLGAPASKAANQGTQITAEDLFYNVATRKKVLRSGAEEFQKVADVITKYAVHNAGIAFSLKKAGESTLAVRTQKGGSARDNVAILYGSSLAKELVEIEAAADGERCGIKAVVSNVNYTAAKKFHFLLFINHRLVESTALKKAIEMVYQAYLPRGSYPFVYLSLSLDPRNVDVNVHPTKHEVHFLHQDDIVEAVQKEIDAKLMASNRSRAYYTHQATAVPLGESDFKNMGQEDAAEATDKTPRVADKNLVRTDARDQKLDKFITVTPVTKNEVESVDCEMAGEEKQISGAATSSAADAAAAGEEERDDAIMQVDHGDGDQVAQDDNWRDMKLGSIKNLRHKLSERGHEGLRNLISNHSFVGCVDHKWSLIQHSTKLYLADNHKVSRELIYQSLIRRFGNLPAIRLSEPVSLKTLALAALETEESGWTEADGEKEELAEFVVRCLKDKTDMLDDYFSLEIDAFGQLCTLPMVLDDHVPSFSALPIYIMRLATEVTWTDEEECLDTFCRETARFYAVQANDPGARYDAKQHEEDDDDDEEKSEAWKSTIEHVIYANAKKHLLYPPKARAEDMTFVQVANLPDLYKVFERC